MKHPWFSRLHNRATRPYCLLVAVVLAFALLVGIEGFFSARTLYSVLQHFATVGLVALGLGLTMIMREFDLSVAGMVGLGGCVAVLCSGESVWLGVAAAMLVGALGGVLQAQLINRLGLSSVAVSLGGLLTWMGLAYVLTGNKTIPFEHMDVAMAMNAPLLGVFSLRSLTVLVLFVLAACWMAVTRSGRDLVAAGGNRKAALVAGVNPARLMTGVFAASGLLAALTGALLSYGLSSATPSGGSADILVAAIVAAILGGVSLSGGVGRPLGIAAGVLVLCVLRTGLTALGAAPFVHDVVTGLVLLIVAIIDGAHLRMRMYQLRQAMPWRSALNSGDSL
ncbi:ABC transporter permease [Pusillimonas sp. CC-YST705]|uniref:Xylose transport system permease protein XylH n=1 Tax=Mesopusillimonas faecipullorum TaxID=2755040 RepID=A0ABS8C987_9BURK|nr:ABC transporter permease [Mesopusillimonas faecipullorum]MCB5362590.1 ABC transporter permease [Mesopusillimonas faecipullorum]